MPSRNRNSRNLTTRQHRFLTALAKFHIQSPHQHTQTNQDYSATNTSPKSQDPIPWPAPAIFQRWLADPRFARALIKTRQAMHAALQLRLLQGSTAAAASLTSRTTLPLDPKTSESARRSSSDLIRYLRQLCPTPPDEPEHDSDCDDDQFDPEEKPNNTAPITIDTNLPFDDAFRRAITREFKKLFPQYNDFIPPPLPPDHLPEPWRKRALRDPRRGDHPATFTPNVPPKDPESAN